MWAQISLSIAQKILILYVSAICVLTYQCILSVPTVYGTLYFIIPLTVHSTTYSIYVKVGCTMGQFCVYKD